MEAKIARATRPFPNEIERLDAVTGVERRVAEAVLAEVEPDLKSFSTPQFLISQAGMCPGN